MNKPFALLVIAVGLAMIVVPRLQPRSDDSGMVDVPTELARRVFLERSFFPADYVNPDSLQCVIMERNTGGDTVAMLVAFADGATSLYLSTGRGILNKRSRNVREAADRFQALAKDRVDQFTATGNFGRPTNGMTRFFVITGSRTLATEAYANAFLASQYSVLQELNAAALATITELRKKT